MSYTGLAKNSIRRFGSRHDNGCGQAAAATVLNIYNRLPAGGDPVEQLYGELPPDVVFGWAGTSPGRVEEILHRHGIGTRYFNRASANGYPMAQLAAVLRDRKPVICLIDGIKLGGDSMAHYVVAFGYDDDGVWITNSQIKGGEHHVPYTEWEKVWECWYMPNNLLKYVGLYPA